MYKPTLFLAALMFAGPALASDPRCDIRVPPSETCPGPDYLLVSPPPEGNHCPKLDCAPPPQPPGFERVDCYYDLYTGYNCEAWPQGEVTYTWAASAGLALMDPGPTQNAEQYVSCSPGSRGGVLFVTVTSPYGLSSSGWVQLSCRNDQEH